MKRTNILAPSILAADFTCLGDNIKSVSEAGAQYLHIDVMDGMFVPSISFGMPVIRSIRGITDCVFDVHLMIEDPDRYLEELVKCGADSITVHAESCRHLHRTVQAIRELGVKAGVALNPGTSLDTLEYVLEDLDMVLLMTVNPGFGGQTYIPSMTEKIRRMRRIVCERDLSLDIQVDGGVNEDTIRTVLNAGANICVAGSAVFRDDIKGNVKKYLSIMEEYQTYENV